MATSYTVHAVRDRGFWQVFIDGFLVTEVRRWPAVGFVAREWVALTDDVPSASVDLHIRVVGKNQYIDI